MLKVPIIPDWAYEYCTLSVWRKHTVSRVAVVRYGYIKHIISAADDVQDSSSDNVQGDGRGVAVVAFIHESDVLRKICLLLNVILP